MTEVVSPRLDPSAADPDGYKPLMDMEKHIHGGPLDEGLLALVKLRASQINGCAFCLDMHSKEARKAGVDQRLLDVLPGWAEAPGLYSARQRAAIALTEQVTKIGQGGVSDEVWDAASTAFTTEEITMLLMAITAINTWNRLAVSTHMALPDE